MPQAFCFSSLLYCPEVPKPALLTLPHQNIVLTVVANNWGFSLLLFCYGSMARFLLTPFPTFLKLEEKDKRKILDKEITEIDKSLLTMTTRLMESERFVLHKGEYHKFPVAIKVFKNSPTISSG